MTEKELAERMARMPEHLRFFFVPSPKEVVGDERLQFWRERMVKVRQHRDELIAHGINVDFYLTNAEPKVQAMEELGVQRKIQEDIVLNSTADIADMEYDIFRLRGQALKIMEEENPFSPEVQELREELEELAKYFPKE